MDEEELPTEDYPEEPEAKPPKEEIRIVEMSDLSGEPVEKNCRVCGKLKPIYVEIESEGVVEYTCKECFEKDVSYQGKVCKKCEAPLSVDDAFCGKCGTPTENKCGECGAVAKDDDAFCGKCGKKL